MLPETLDIHIKCERMPQISIVSPVYRAEKIVPVLVENIITHVQKITSDFEIILVEDCGPDNSWKSIELECSKSKKVKGIKLSRNFGQHYAITAGLDAAKGEWVVVMDCDMQDKPSEIPKLYAKAKEGYDIVLARRALRKDSLHKKLFSRFFYQVLGYLTGTEQDPAIANFGIYHYKTISAINSLRESIRYFPTMVKWVGFKQTTVDIDHGERESGSTSYNFKRLFRLALDIILANSNKPIILTIKFGFLMALCSFLFGVGIIVQYFRHQIMVMGYTSLLVSIWFLAGLIMVMLGVVGLYIGKTFEGVKNRPIYIIDQQVNNG